MNSVIIHSYFSSYSSLAGSPTLADDGTPSEAAVVELSLDPLPRLFNPFDQRVWSYGLVWCPNPIFVGTKTIYWSPGEHWLRCFIFLAHQLSCAALVLRQFCIGENFFLTCPISHHNKKGRRNKELSGHVFVLTTAIRAERTNGLREWVPSYTKFCEICKANFYILILVHTNIEYIFCSAEPVSPPLMLYYLSIPPLYRYISCNNDSTSLSVLSILLACRTSTM